MSDQLYIPADGTISLEIKGYSTKQQQSPDDANWLSALVTVTSSSISSRIDAFVTINDLHRFRDELRDGICGKRQNSSLSSDEDEVHITITFGNTNQCKITGYLKEIGYAKVITTFEFTIDHGSLCRVAENLDTMLETYPIV